MQLARVFHLDLWRARRPGEDERFDPDRFGTWLEVLVDLGSDVAADKLAGMDVDLVAAGLAQHIRVFDVGVVTPFMTTDGEQSVSVRPIGDGLVCDVHGYRLVARQTEVWDTIVAVLTALGLEHRQVFGRVMSACCRMSNSAPEIDGLHDVLGKREQAMFDVDVDREEHQEADGYVAPAQARAFLDLARRRALRDDHGVTPTADPIASAYFRSSDSPARRDTRAERALLRVEPAAMEGTGRTADGVDALVELLHDAGIVERQVPRALLDEPRNHSRLALIHAQMAVARDNDPDAHSRRTTELAYLANTLIAGCAIQGRRFTAREASDAAVAVCNLGLENWPGAPGLTPDLLVTQDLVRVFQVGWTILYDDVCISAGARLIDVLTDLRCVDREIQSELDALRMALTKHVRAGTPWLARNALDAIAILDMPASAALQGLIDECPVVHAALGASLHAGARTVSPTAFELVSENSQIATIRQFLELLPEILRR